MWGGGGRVFQQSVTTKGMLPKVIVRERDVCHQVKTEKNFLVKNTPMNVAFSPLFSVFGYLDKTLSLVFEIYYYIKD